MIVGVISLTLSLTQLHVIPGKFRKFGATGPIGTTDEKSITGETGQFTRMVEREGDAMKRGWLSKLSLTACALAFLAIGTVRAEEVGRVVVIREAGKPDHRCLIERSTLQTNGSKVYDVRDLDTGERLRVLDKRTAKAAPSSVTQTAAKQTVPSDAGMTAALAASPFASQTDEKRVPTLAEQASIAGKTSVVRTGLFRLFDK